MQPSRFEVMKASVVLVSQTFGAIAESQRAQEQQLMTLLPSSPISTQSNDANDVSCVVAFVNLIETHFHNYIN